MERPETPTAVFLAGRAFALAGPRLELMRALADHGWRVIAVAACDAHADRIEQRDVPFVRLPMERQGFSPLLDGRGVARFAQLIRQMRPRLLHTFQAKPTLVGALAARLSPTTKLVNTVTGLGTLFGSNSVMASCGRSILRLATRRCDATVWQCEDDRRELADRRFRSGKHSRVIVGTGVDTDRFSPKPTDIGRGVRVLMASRFVKQKGVADYIEAARLSSAAGDDATYHLAGPWDFSHPDAVDRRSVEASIRSGVLHYEGEIADMSVELPRYTVAALPSYREGTPRFMMEAAACGVPVVTTDAPGCRETVIHGASGLLTPVGDPARLREAIATLAAAPTRRAEMGRAGRELALEKFDMHAVNAQYLRLYSDLGLPSPSDASATGNTTPLAA